MERNTDPGVSLQLVPLMAYDSISDLIRAHSQMVYSSEALSGATVAWSVHMHERDT